MLVSRAKSLLIGLPGSVLLSLSLRALCAALGRAAGSTVLSGRGPAAFLVPFFLLSAAVVQVNRYQRVSTPRERQQTKWAVFGFALAMLVLVVTLPISVLVVPATMEKDSLCQAFLGPIRERENHSEKREVEKCLQQGMNQSTTPLSAVKPLRFP